MKRFIGILITVVMCVMFGMALADSAYKTYAEARELIYDFAEQQGYEDWRNEKTTESILYGLGIMTMEDFKKESGKDFSVDNFEEWTKANFDICEMHTQLVGFAEGCEVYRTQAQSERDVLGTKDGIGYYCVDILFIMYEENVSIINEIIIEEDYIK